MLITFSLSPSFRPIEVRYEYRSIFLIIDPYGKMTSLKKMKSKLYVPGVGKWIFDEDVRWLLKIIQDKQELINSVESLSMVVHYQIMSDKKSFN